MNSIVLETQSTIPSIDIIQKELDTLLKTIKDKTGVPGISLAVNIGEDKIISNIGTVAIDSDVPMTENTQFQLGCISKLMTAMVAAELISAGKLDPDDQIEKYIEELRGTVRGKELKIWHLLSHTSGYRGLNLNDPGVAYYYTWYKFLKYIIDAQQLFKPGTVFSYEHSEYAMLGEIITRITGYDILDLYREMIIEPLKLKTGNIRLDQRDNEVYAVDHVYDSNTKRFIPLKPIPFAYFWKASLNSLTMNMQDLLTIASTICRIIKTPSSISENALNYVQKQVVKLPQIYGSTRHEQIPITFGIGCAVYGNGLLGHNGSARGQTCGLRFDPQEKISMVIGINVWKPYFRDSIIDHILSTIFQKPVQRFIAPSFELSLNDLAGTYVGPNGNEIKVICVGDQVIFTLTSIYAPSTILIMQKDENSHLHALSDTKHYSLGFFREPNTGIEGLMLGMTAFRKRQ